MTSQTLKRWLPLLALLLAGFALRVYHADHQEIWGDEGAKLALVDFDRFYPQENGQSALQQLLAQLASALPFDLDEIEPGLQDYKNLDSKWHAWANVKTAAARLSVTLFDRLPP